MKTMLKHYIELYKVTVYFTPDAEEFRKFTGHSTEGCNGMVAYHSERGSCTIWVPIDEDGSVNFGTLAHECFHAADFIFDLKDMEYTHRSGNEHMAYLLGHIVDQVTKHIGKLVKNGYGVKNAEDSNS